MVDVISNMSLVWLFCGPGRERHRFDRTIARQMAARQSNLERLRILHGTVTIISLLLGFAMLMHGRP